MVPSRGLRLTSRCCNSSASVRSYHVGLAGGCFLLAASTLSTPSHLSMWQCLNVLVLLGLVLDNMVQAGFSPPGVVKATAVLHCVTPLLICEIIEMARDTPVWCDGMVAVHVVAALLVVAGLSRVLGKDEPTIAKEHDLLRHHTVAIVREPLSDEARQVWDTILPNILPCQLTVLTALLVSWRMTESGSQVDGSSELFSASLAACVGFGPMPALAAKHPWFSPGSLSAGWSMFPLLYLAWQNSLELVWVSSLLVGQHHEIC